MAKKMSKPFDQWTTQSLDDFRIRMNLKAQRVESSIQKLEKQMEAYTMNRRLLDAAHAGLQTLEQRALELMNLAMEHASGNTALIAHTKQQLARYRQSRNALPTVSTRQPNKSDLMVMGAKLDALRFKLNLARQQANEVSEVLKGRGED